MSNIHTRKRRKKEQILRQKKKEGKRQGKKKSLKMTDDWRLTKINKDEF